MPGSFDLDNPGAPLWGYALPVAVYAYSPGGGLSLLPNVLCLRVDRREGGMPSAARLTYVLDDVMSRNFGWPNRTEQVFGLGAPAGPYTLLPDQRIVVVATNPDGTPWPLFDGFAQVQDARINGGDGRGAGAAEGVAFGAIGADGAAIHTARVDA